MKLGIEAMEMESSGGTGRDGANIAIQSQREANVAMPSHQQTTP